MNLPAAAAIVFYLALNLGIAFADQPTEKPIVAAAQSWLGEIDAGNYVNSWKRASSYFQGAVTEKNWTDALTGSRRPLGKLLARTLVKTQNATSLPGAPDGNYLVMQFSIRASKTRSPP